jgi:hypothetical protein
MTLPEFTFSKSFLGRFEIPCLWVTVKNSRLPGIASRHIQEFGEDPDCAIYLRGRKAKTISPWQQEILDQLLKNEGLAAAVTEAMKEYETSSKWGGKDYAELAEEDRLKILQYGIPAYITVSTIVIDEIKRKVIIRANTIIDGNLDEHGIAIFLSKGHWRFETADYFIRYQSNFAEGDGILIWGNAEKKWDLLYPPGEPIESTEANVDLLIGNWELNISESKRLMKQLGVPTDDGEFLIQNVDYKGLAISRDAVRYFDLSPPQSFAQFRLRVLRCERRGNRFTLQLRYQELTSSGYAENPGDEHIQTMNFWCDGRVMVERRGLVYLPTAKAATEKPYHDTWGEMLKDIAAWQEKKLSDDSQS